MSEEKPAYETRKQTIFRTIKNAENPFVMIDRRPIENPVLSWKAKGILAYLLSRPDNWVVRIGDLIKRSPDGAYAVRGAINELQKSGHLRRKEIREKGRFIRYELEVYELPFTGSPLINYPQAGKPQADNRVLNDIDLNETELKDIGVPPNYPLEWKIGADVETIIQQDDTFAQMTDAANLIATGTGSKAREIFALVMAFQNARHKIFTESDIKGQRKAAKILIEKKIKPSHVTQAVTDLLAINYTVTDFYSVLKTADNLANPSPETTGYNPQGLAIT